ncbi:MAG TPA: PilZ domain-containing protein [Gemmataceae bacterium]|nr:PilZ domain-containing protein [Gemmataceae bacterium]
MSAPDLQPVADAVLRLAKRQGHVTARDVRSELRIAGLPEAKWKDAIGLIQSSLVHRQGRYYHRDTFSPRVKKEHAQQLAIQKVIRRLIRHHRQRGNSDERRRQVRVDFIQPVKIRTEEGKEFRLMSRDLSTTGVRLLGTKQLLGQKVELELPSGADDEPACRVLVRILWTCSVGDDLFENGGSFVELLS